jgi:hypothetical protein
MRGGAAYAKRDGGGAGDGECAGGQGLQRSVVVSAVWGVRV